MQWTLHLKSKDVRLLMDDDICRKILYLWTAVTVFVALLNRLWSLLVLVLWSRSCLHHWFDVLKSFIKNLVRAKSVLNRNRPSINRCKKLQTQLLRCQEVFIDLVHWLITSTALRSMRSIYFSTFSCRSSGFIGNNRARFQPPGGAVDDSQRTQRTCS